MRPLHLLAGQLACALPALAQAQADVPPLAYDAAADEACAGGRLAQVDPAWVSELHSRLPEVQALWQAQAPAWFGAASKLLGRAVNPPFGAIRLTLCDMPSQSFGGPVVNMRYALRSFTATPVPLRAKIDTAFHESLHRALQPLQPQQSALLQAHADEPPCVRNHLHLLALHKAVLLSLGQEQAWADMVAVDGQLPSDCYRRAWRILGATPDAHTLYVQELAGG